MASDVELKRAGLNAEYRALVERVMPEGMWNWCERHAPELTRLLDASRPSPTQEQREAIGRIVDPLASWEGVGWKHGYDSYEEAVSAASRRQAQALAKVDAIITLLQTQQVNRG